MDQANLLLSSLIAGSEQNEDLTSSPSMVTTTVPEPTAEYESVSHYKRRDSSRERRSSRRDRSRSKGRRDRSRSRRRDRRDRRERSRSRERRSSIDRRRRDRSVTPIHLKKSKLNNWDIPPPGYEHLTSAEVKAMGIFPIPGQPSRAVPRISASNKSNAGDGIGGHSANSRPASRNTEDRFPYSPWDIHLDSYFAPSSPSHSQRQYSYKQHQPQALPNPVLIQQQHMRQLRQEQEGKHPENQEQQEQQKEVEEPKQPTIPKSSLRLYFGGIPSDTAEQSLVKFINETMIRLNLASGDNGPAVSANVNCEKAYAFIEFQTVEYASAAMSLDGLPLQGSILKIRRPKDYKPSDDEKKPSRVYIPGVVSTNVEDSETKVFIGGIPSYLNEEQVMELLKAFGELKSFNLIRDASTGQSKGFAFCEFMTLECAEAACQGLNAMNLGDKNLVVQKANPIGVSNKPAGSIVNIPRTLSVLPSTFLAATSGENVPSNVLLIMNLCSPEEAEDDFFVQGLKEEVRKELSQYGLIKSIEVTTSDFVGKVFIHYESAQDCQVALKACAGRLFDGRIVVATFFPEYKYLDGLFTF